MSNGHYCCYNLMAGEKGQYVTANCLRMACSNYNFFQLSCFPWHVFFPGAQLMVVLSLLSLFCGSQAPRGKLSRPAAPVQVAKAESKESGNLCFSDHLRFAYRGKRLHKICLTHR